jgi:hypothetical protein
MCSPRRGADAPMRPAPDSHTKRRLCSAQLSLAPQYAPVRKQALAALRGLMAEPPADGATPVDTAYAATALERLTAQEAAHLLDWREAAADGAPWCARQKATERTGCTYWLRSRSCLTGDDAVRLGEVRVRTRRVTSMSAAMASVLANVSPSQHHSCYAGG